MTPRDPRPWHRALAELPACFSVTAFRWWHQTAWPMIQLCVFGHAVSMRPFPGRHAYVVYLGSIDDEAWQHAADLDDDQLPVVVVTHLRAAALDAVRELVREEA